MQGRRFQSLTVILTFSSLANILLSISSNAHLKLGATQNVELLQKPSLSTIQKILTLGRVDSVRYDVTLVTLNGKLKPLTDLFGYQDTTDQTSKKIATINEKVDQDNGNNNDDNSKIDDESGHNSDNGQNHDDAEAPITKVNRSSSPHSSGPSSNTIFSIIVLVLIVIIILTIALFLYRNKQNRSNMLKIRDDNYLNFDDNQVTASDHAQSQKQLGVPTNMDNQPIQVIQNEHAPFLIDTNAESQNAGANDDNQVENLEAEQGNTDPNVAVKVDDENAA